MVLREISGAKGTEVTGDRRKLHSKELHVRLGSSNEGRCDWRQCGKCGQKIHTEFWCGSLRGGKIHMEDLDTDEG
jgi:hypothetical protein